MKEIFIWICMGLISLSLFYIIRFFLYATPLSALYSIVLSLTSISLCYYGYKRDQKIEREKGGREQ